MSGTVSVSMVAKVAPRRFSCNGCLAKYTGEGDVPVPQSGEEPK